ncbi:MAG: hypothetical protein KY397_06095 [Gemmatimonadetes bacterium]|nr:hypothetical protein [Gemmatimonadota bacterium]
MSDVALHPTPGLRAAAAAQLKAVGLAVRREVLVAAILFGGILLFTVLYALGKGESMGLGHIGGPGVLVGLAAFLFPVAVWKDEERFGLSTLWTLPVDHTRHALLKVAAGWVWVMGLTIALMLSLILGVLITGGSLGVETTRLVLDVSAPSGMRTVEWSTPWWQWLVPFCAASTTYLLGSALVLAADHPWRWILGAILVFWLLGFMGDEGEVEWMYWAFEHLLFQVGFGQYGLEPLLTSGTESIQHRFHLPSGESVVGWRELPSIGRWAGAVGLWSAIGLAGLFAATWRHRER